MPGTGTDRSRVAGEQLLREGPGGAAGSVPWARGKPHFGVQ